ncbi:MAG: hypothetical protein IPO71_13825 [Nitrosomonas sp.]|nr:hypothetical protein [Nitrosomonas sp.]
MRKTGACWFSAVKRHNTQAIGCPSIFDPVAKQSCWIHRAHFRVVYALGGGSGSKY